MSCCSELMFEKAYCEYRLNKNEQALETLKAVQKLDLRCKELKAQLVGICIITVVNIVGQSITLIFFTVATVLFCRLNGKVRWILLGYGCNACYSFRFGVKSFQTAERVENYYVFFLLR